MAVFLLDHEECVGIRYAVPMENFVKGEGRKEFLVVEIANFKCIELKVKIYLPKGCLQGVHVW